jgi:hypothetical protein
VPTAINDDLEVHVATGRVSGCTGERDQFTLLDLLANLGD